MRPPPTKYVTVDDAQVAYQVVGDGPVDLVFHHGFCHLDLAWDVRSESAFLRALAEFARVIRFDRRGSGASERVGHFPTWEEWNRDLLAVLDAVGSPRVALFVEGEAGPMAMLFAAAHPDRVSHLVLANTAARIGADDDYPIGIPLEDVDALVELLESTWGEPSVLGLFMPSLQGDLHDVEAQARLMRAAATPRSAAAQYRHIFTQLDARDALALISAPTVILQNAVSTQLDPATGRPERARYLAEHIPGARFVELPGQDVLLFAGDHGPVIAEVAEFLTGRRPEPPAERFLTTLLFSDIVASTERAVEMGDAPWRRLLDAHDQSVRDRLQRYDGDEVNTTGDGFVACFDGPARAIRCALEIVEGARELGVQVRIGLHTGECERRGSDIAGLAVHLAARIGSLAGSGEVLVSRTVRDLVAGSGIGFDERGHHQLKGIPDSWDLYAVRSA